MLDNFVTKKQWDDWSKFFRGEGFGGPSENDVAVEMEEATKAEQGIVHDSFGSDRKGTFFRKRSK